MIDVHCHLEQEDFDKDREKVIAECAKRMKAVVSSAAAFSDLEKTLFMHRKHPNFVFISLGIHPTYIKEVNDLEIEQALAFIRKNKSEISAIGETGLDYYHVKDEKLREKQKEMFERFIDLALELKKPIVIHSRDARDECIKILEKKGMKNKKVLMHLFQGKPLLKRVIENGWMISIGPNILKSKETRKIARDCPISNLMLETDSPWFGYGERGTPLNVFKAAARIAEIKKIPAAEIEKQADLNAEKFFEINISK